MVQCTFNLFHLVSLREQAHLCEFGENYFGDGICISEAVCKLILLHEKFLQFDWLRAVVFQFEIPKCENYKPFAGSSINK